jgi:toxin ParE1/3/4
MKSLSYFVKATADLDAIWDYSFEQWGLDQAERYTRELRNMCRALASGAKKGRKVSIRPGLSKVRCGSHLIYYRDLPDRLEVIRILHDAQDVERHLQD